MINYFDKEDMKNIKKLNAALNTKHRYKPYNLNNVNDLNHAMKYAVCAFWDYCHYAAQLDDILEKYDESLEHYDTATWLNFTINIDKADELSWTAYNSLKETSKIFDVLSHRAEKHCSDMLKIVLASNSDIQKDILGYSYQLDEILIAEIIENVFEAIFKLEYHYNMEEAFESFKTHVKHIIEAVLKTKTNKITAE